MGAALLILIAIGIFLAPDLRSNPLLDVVAVLILLGAIGMLYSQWLSVRSKQAMIDLDRRDSKR